MLPADIKIAVEGAWIGTNPDSGISTNEFIRALKLAMAPDAMLYLDLDEVRNLFKNGDLALGYGRAPLGDGALVQACHASIRCESLVGQSSSESTSGILIVINAPRIAGVKLSEVRDGLRVILQWASKASNHLYSTIHDYDDAGESIEVYLFAVSCDSM